MPGMPAAEVDIDADRFVVSSRRNSLSGRTCRSLHGDLHPANLLVESDRLCGVIDFGDLCVGDPAVDLVSGWMLFPPPARDVFRQATSVDDGTWARGRGWALAIGLACLANG